MANSACFAVFEWELWGCGWRVSSGECLSSSLKVMIHRATVWAILNWKVPKQHCSRKSSRVSPPSLLSHRRPTRCFWRSCPLTCAVARLERLVLQWPSVAVQNAEGLPHPDHHREPGAGLHRLRRAQEMMSFTTAPGHLHQTRLTSVSHT